MGATGDQEVVAGTEVKAPTGNKVHQQHLIVRKELAEEAKGEMLAKEVRAGEGRMEGMARTLLLLEPMM